ncbi:N-acetylglutamate synthase-like GNAT family acetyltransferase [Scopulibacillus daqui]|uniref:N-acetylglutamate synthase-like GNAT family acetyltransferase n=1 Tax=Scopulibacillus daqui TaxID=1469162 RepID=A0ABS2Q0L4_9BACL|nr:hypothetical protein [Scopulibacillus daqui]MBM7645375.1 N-acetylglutamate synthase-like GNAT family acetyltransferase [Scopulibacillus daqui]
MDTVVYIAKAEDREKVKKFTEKAGVSLPESTDNIQFLLLMDKSNALIGVIGIDLINREAVLRSLVIDGSKCKTDDIIYFLNTALAYATKKKATKVYFATPVGSALFAPLGFEEVAFSNLPEYLQRDWEQTYTNYQQRMMFLFKELCT